MKSRHKLTHKHSLSHSEFDQTNGKKINDFIMFQCKLWSLFTKLIMSFLVWISGFMWFISPQRFFFIRFIFVETKMVVAEFRFPKTRNTFSVEAHAVIHAEQGNRIKERTKMRQNKRREMWMIFAIKTHEHKSIQSLPYACEHFQIRKWKRKESKNKTKTFLQFQFFP